MPGQTLSDKPREHLKEFRDGEIQRTIQAFRMAEVLLFLNVNILPINMRQMIREELYKMEHILQPAPEATDGGEE